MKTRTTSVSGGGTRVDWKVLRERIDLATVATALMGPAPGRRGERGRRLWWTCPFHEDGNPSFCIEPGKAWWRCFGCDENGHAANLVMRLRTVDFPEAIRWLADFAGASAPMAIPRPHLDVASAARKKAPSRLEVGTEGMSASDAVALVGRAADRLWRPVGAAALDGLRARGLSDETIRAARLGFDPAVRATARDGRPYSASGLVIPWTEAGRLTLVKVRQPEGRRPKYAQVFRDRPVLYVAAPIQPGRPVLVTEGELDAVLLAQQTADWECGVVTSGSASARPDTAMAGRLLPASPWLIATDADKAGDRAADAWTELARPRCRRVRPPIGPPDGKDWGDLHRLAPNAIRYHLAPLLTAPPSSGGRVADHLGPAADEDSPEARVLVQRSAERAAASYAAYQEQVGSGDPAYADDAAEREAIRWERGLAGP
jgi:DNA primase